MRAAQTQSKKGILLMNTVFRAFSGAAALAACAIAATPAAAQSAADFYKGKTVTILVGFGVGGGVDTFARLMMRHLGAHMPGKPSVIVQNMPGGGGFKSTNYLYNAGPKDGTYVTLMLPSNAVEPIMGNKGAKWDTFELNWLGNMTQDFGSCVASKRSGIKSITETAAKQAIVGATGPSALTAQQPYILANVFGYKLKVITGYKGTRELWNTMEKGETDIACAFWASLAMGPQKAAIESGQMVPVVQFGKKKHPVYGNTPSVFDLARNEDERKLLNFVFGLTEITRPMAAPPGVPADRLAALRDGFWAAVNSPALKADATKMKLIIDPQDWKETEKAFRDALNAPKEIVDKAKVVIRKPRR
jgi:tripartite-type tricarboxylate transporter receptor subunit TctC